MIVFDKSLISSLYVQIKMSTVGVCPFRSDMLFLGICFFPVNINTYMLKANRPVVSARNSSSPIMKLWIPQFIGMLVKRVHMYIRFVMKTVVMNIFFAVFDFFEMLQSSRIEAITARMQA